MAEKKKERFKPGWVTAADAVKPHEDSRTDEEKHVAAAYVDYTEALGNYEDRPDVETLDSRRRRENGGDFEAAEHMRPSKESLEEAAKQDVSVTAPPEPGKAKVPVNKE